MTRLDKHQIARNFNSAAAEYEQHAVLQQTVSSRLLDRLDLVSLAPKRILDAGAGTGSCARALSKRYGSARVLQIDLATTMLFQSKRKSRKFFSRQHYICADVEALPIATGVIDLIFSSLTYQWCENLDKAFAEARRILRPNGMLLFATLGPDTLKELRASWQGVDNAEHVSVFFDMHDIGDALIRAGLEGVVMDSEVITMEYPDCISLMRDIKAAGAHNANQARPRGLTGRKKIRQVETTYETFRRNGRLPTTYEIVYGHAWAPAQDRVKPERGITYIPLEQLRKHK